jgi:hypothetical protein
MIIEQYIDAAGYIRIVWQMADGNALMLKYKEQPTEEQLQAEEAKYIEQQELERLRLEKLSEEDGTIG